jgi:peptidoglycan hydrolase-like protein with peptidoglycan-binding domain
VVQRQPKDAPAAATGTLDPTQDLVSDLFANDIALKACFNGKRTFKLGDKGMAVAKIQRALMTLGANFPFPRPNAIFGPETKTSVEFFQRSYAMPANQITGIVDKPTISKLDVALLGHPGPVPDALTLAPLTPPGGAATPTLATPIGPVPPPTLTIPKPGAAPPQAAAGKAATTDVPTDVAVAADPANTLSGHQMFQIWFQLWIRRHNAALANVNAIERRLWRADQVAYANNKSLFDAGKRDALGPEHQAAADRRDSANYMLSAVPDILNWLEDWVDSAKHHVTLDQVDKKAREIAHAKGLFQEFVTPVFLGIVGAGMARAGRPPPAAAEEAPAAPAAAKGGAVPSLEEWGDVPSPPVKPNAEVPAAEPADGPITVRVPAAGNRTPAQGRVVAAARPVATPEPGVVGPTTLTAEEAAQIQALADKYNTQIDVIGSRAAGRGRNIETNLPVGKGRGTRSDIDFRYDGQVEIDTSGTFTNELHNVGRGAGSPSFVDGPGNSTPPVIEFKPGVPAVLRTE